VPGFHQRFVGLTELPRSIPQFDVDESFQLSQHDIDEVRYHSKSPASALRFSWSSSGQPVDRPTNSPAFRAPCSGRFVYRSN
jgi:hypothetical protein